MAFSMSRRERVILIVTVVVSALALIYHFGLKSMVTSFADQREELRQQKETYDRCIQELRREEKLAKDFVKLESNYPMTDQRVKEFTTTIDAAFQSAGMAANILPPEEEDIPGAEDYGYVTLRIQSDGNINSVTKILNFFDRQAILIKDLKLTTSIDSPRIRIDVWVSQIVKRSEEAKAAKDKKSGGRETRGKKPSDI